MLVFVLGVVTKVLSYGVILVLGLWGWFYWTHRALIREAEKLPTLIPRWPLIGNALYSIGSLDDITLAIINFWEEAARRHIYTYVYWAGPLPLVIVSGAEDIKKLLNTSLHQGYELENFLKDFMGNGLLTAPAEHWKMTRRHMNSVFHPRNCEQCVPVFNQNSKELVSRLSKHVDKGPVDVVEYVMETALKSICYLTFGEGTKIDVESRDFKNFLHTAASIPGLLIERIVKFWLRSDSTFHLFRRKELREKHAIIKKFFDVPLKEALEKYEQKKEKLQSASKNTHTGLSDKEIHHEEEFKGLATVVEVYAALRESNPSITETHLYDELTTTCLTGAETVSSAVSFMLLILGQYQDIQDKLYKEITSVMGAEDDVTLEDMNRMPYFEQVIKETLRFVKVVPFMTRTMQEDIKLTSVTVPAGFTVYMALGGLHMDPKIYPEPEKFDPDRFAQNGSTKINDKNYIPFSRGPRGCIGKSYAQMFMRVMIVHILRKYHITTTMDYRTTKKKFVVTMASAEGVHLSLNYRS